MERSGKRPAHQGVGHRQRLRERFISNGLDGFHDYEVIELLLTLNTPRKDCKPPAKAAMARFGSLPAVLAASRRELCEVPGIGEKNATGILLVRAVADRYLEQRIIGRDPVRNSRELFDFLFHRLRDRPRECFMVLFLNARNRVLGTEILFEGTLTGSSVYPREVALAALDHHAAALIFAHNHPSGNPEPSREDIALTRQLVFACASLGISVHEHLVVGNNRYYSFADQGRIARMLREYERLQSRTDGSDADGLG